MLLTRKYTITLDNHYLLNLKPKGYDCTEYAHDALQFDSYEIKGVYHFLDRLYGSFTDIKVIRVDTIVSIQEIKVDKL